MLAAQAELAATLADLRRSAGEGTDAGLIAECEDQRGALLALQQGLASASPAALQTMRREVAAAIGASQGVLQQVRAATAGAAGESAQLAAAGAATRREVQSLHADLFERRIFDGNLRFTSNEDEEAYRQREAENRKTMERQLAANTPEGNLNAAGTAMGQMLDAHAHGAGASPDFLPRWNRLVDTTHKHREALRNEGRATDEFDRNLASSVRRYLRDKGLSDAEIEAKLAVATDPLDAVRPYLKNDDDAKTLSASVANRNYALTLAVAPITTATMLTNTQSSPASITELAAAPVGLDDVMAVFRAAGVASADESTALANGVNAAAETMAGRAPRTRA